ncbi:hypothetical protein BKA67DRAFT_531025 [Truncatella angustata]|uniref:F-box domain-containing protein n=1 Tax=Truncatella angustata TaxID=152316 RepID=A0A9P9A2P8_9PEZI|nr:uncharacterized protein BKA67DRAFT_531025 [Truncatella angustata]KAH6660946.1 hypothetical protein BKA67DRAFT_531025 [Truncatella angustata]KAH8196732.1 hypothetical protein TruAng_009087 [Truncatella angustata]
MDRLSPELLHIVVLFLDIKDRLNFRLVSKNLSVIAGAHILPEVSFHLHAKDLAKLRGIAANSVLARNVKSLTYFAARLEALPFTYEQYVHDHQQTIQFSLIDLELTELRKWKLFQSPAQLKAHYETYLEMVASQNALIADQMDRLCLEEVLPSFPNLQQITMSSGHEFYEGRNNPKSVYDGCLRDAHDYAFPPGVAQLEVLLQSLAHHRLSIQELRAGSMSWRFFDKEPDVLSRLFAPLHNLKYIDLVLEIQADDNGVVITDDISKCRSLLKSGGLRNLLTSMPGLDTLAVAVRGDWEDRKPAASLNWIIAPDHHWPTLSTLVLEGFDCTREDLWKFLELHRNSLSDICLRDVSLTKGSWQKLLPDVRSTLQLQEVCFCGRLSGYPEGSEETAYGWDGSDGASSLVEVHDLWTPESGPSDMRSSVNCYCRQGGKDYPDELPLSNEVVKKYFESHVRKTMAVHSEAEDEEEMRKAEKRVHARMREMNIFGFRDARPEDSSDEWSGISGSELDEDDLFFETEPLDDFSTEDDTDLSDMVALEGGLEEQEEGEGEEGSTDEEETAHMVALEELSQDDSDEGNDIDDADG